MKTCAKTILLAFTMVFLAAAPFAEAARLGKGSSFGMRRTTPTQPSQNSAAPQQAATVPPTPSGQTQPRQGAGVGTAVAAGAAGAVAGYALGSMGGNTQPTNAADSTVQNPADNSWGQTQAASGIPWGMIIILGALFLAGLVWFRRKIAPPTPTTESVGQPINREQSARFEAIPKIGSGSSPNAQDSPVQPARASIARLTDGTESPYFLRQAKATFLHLQSLNTPDNLEEMRKYLVPDLFESLRDAIVSNNDVADFLTLNCQLVESTEEAPDRHIASVSFSGMVSESVNVDPVPFAEVWHYVKDSRTNGNRWLVSGIQQD